MDHNLKKLRKFTSTLPLFPLKVRCPLRVCEVLKLLEAHHKLLPHAPLFLVAVWDLHHIEFFKCSVAVLCCVLCCVVCRGVGGGWVTTGLVVRPPQQSPSLPGSVGQADPSAWVATHEKKKKRELINLEIGKF